MRFTPKHPEGEGSRGYARIGADSRLPAARGSSASAPLLPPGSQEALSAPIRVNQRLVLFSSVPSAANDATSSRQMAIPKTPILLLAVLLPHDV